MSRWERSILGGLLVGSAGALGLFANCVESCLPHGPPARLVLNRPRSAAAKRLGHPSRLARHFQAALNSRR